MNHELLNITISDQIFRDTMMQIDLRYSGFYEAITASYFGPLRKDSFQIHNQLSPQ